jgi:hypothetical protein
MSQNMRFFPDKRFFWKTLNTLISKINHLSEGHARNNDDARASER